MFLRPVLFSRAVRLNVSLGWYRVRQRRRAWLAAGGAEEEPEESLMMDHSSTPRCELPFSSRRGASADSVGCPVQVPSGAAGASPALVGRMTRGEYEVEENYFTQLELMKYVPSLMVT